jgi:hypothetical protein
LLHFCFLCRFYCYLTCFPAASWLSPQTTSVLTQLPLFLGYVILEQQVINPMGDHRSSKSISQSSNKILNGQLAQEH